MPGSLHDSTLIRRELDDLRRRLSCLTDLEDEHRAVAEELHRVQAILEATVEQAPAGVVVVSAPDKRIMLTSRHALGIFGKTGDPQRNLSFREYMSGWELLHADGTPYVPGTRPLELVLLGETYQDYEVLVRDTGGNRRWVLVNAAPVRNSEGRIIAGVAIFSDVTRLKDLEAQRANTLTFFAHDMKSPLLSIRGLLERMIQGKAGLVGDRHMKYLRIMRGEADRVLSLAQDFLDVARLENGAYHLSTQPVLLEPILLELTEEFSQRAGEKGLLFRLETPREKLPNLVADLHRLQRVLANLLDNAVKYTQKGEVTLRAWVSEGRVFLEVADQGPGLSPEDLAKLFKPFERGSAAAGSEGSGLGLAAVRAIVEAHGGRVEGGNRPGGGARFLVELPLPPGRLDPRVATA